MKLGQITVALAALLAGSASFAGTISGSSNVEFLAFDGQKVKKSTVLQANENQTHQVVVEVSTIYRAGNDDVFFESDPIVLSFKGSQENLTISAPKLASESDVSKFKKSPQFTLKTASGNTIEYKQDYLKGSGGFLPNANVVENLANYNAGDNVAAVKSLASVSMPAVLATSDKAAKGKVVVQGENVAEQQLQYWFQQADKETQKRFLDWAKKQ